MYNVLETANKEGEGRQKERNTEKGERVLKIAGRGRRVEKSKEKVYNVLKNANGEGEGDRKRDTQKGEKGC